MSDDVNSESLEKSVEKSFVKTSDAAVDETIEGLPDLVKDGKDWNDYLKAGGTSGITSEFGKPGFIDTDKAGDQSYQTGGGAGDTVPGRHGKMADAVDPAPVSPDLSGGKLQNADYNLKPGQSDGKAGDYKTADLKGDGSKVQLVGDAGKDGKPGAEPLPEIEPVAPLPKPKSIDADGTKHYEFKDQNWTVKKDFSGRVDFKDSHGGSYEHDPHSNITKLTTKDGKSYEFGYDSDNKLKDVHTPDGRSYYTADGQNWNMRDDNTGKTYQLGKKHPQFKVDKDGVSWSGGPDGSRVHHSRNGSIVSIDKNGRRM